MHHISIIESVQVMLELRKKYLNASMFQFPEQEMLVSLGEAPMLDAGKHGVPSLEGHFSDGLGVVLGSGEVFVGISIDKPVLKLDEETFDQLVDAGVVLSGAYNIAVLDIYDKLARSVTKDLLTKPGEPTFLIQYKKNHDGERPPVEKVEIIIKGKPTGHHYWTLEKL